MCNLVPTESVFFFMLPRPPTSTLFPYTTLFRSVTEQSVRFQTALASIKLIQAKAVWKRDRKSGSAGMPRPISYAVFCLKKKKSPTGLRDGRHLPARGLDDKLLDLVPLYLDAIGL